jgi:RNA polymerase sigma-70 factor, ECF subfamily
MDPSIESRDEGTLGGALRYEGQLLRHARHLAGNEADARDLVQDTFEKALRAAKRPRTVEEFRPWLMRVLNNVWIDRFRAARSREIVPYCDDRGGGRLVEEMAITGGAAGDSSTGSADGWRDLSMSDIAAVLPEVPEPHRTAFRLFALERMTYAEVASSLGVVPATVGTRILRARRVLRAIFAARFARKRLRVCQRGA